MKNKHKQPIFSYLFSTILLLGLFVTTMLNHYDGNIDLNYLKSAIYRILLISLVLAVAIILLNIRKLHSNLALTLLLSLGAATLYVQIATKT